MADAQLIMKLRRATGAGMMECKKALEESNDDFDKAIEVLRKSGAAKAAKKADRETCEGAIRIKLNEDNKKGAIVQINCETDFVAKNDDFIAAVDNIVQKSLDQTVNEVFDQVKEELVLKIGENIQFGRADILEADYVTGYVHANNKVGALVSYEGEIDPEIARDIAMHAVAMSPKYLDSQSVPKEDMEKEKDVYREQLKKEGKPEDIIEKILEGKMSKFYEENCLLEQRFIKDEDKKIKDLLGDAKIKSFVIYSL